VQFRVVLNDNMRLLSCKYASKLYLVIPLSQILVIELQVHLRRIQVTMTKQLLHTPQVKSRPHEVDRKAVPERMRVDVDIDHPAVLLADVPDLHA